MNIDYLKYEASSIQQLLRRKLTQSGILTDQLYPGSDTKIIIDLFSWTFDVLTYMLNNSAADSLFSDTYLYQNLNRLVKLLSYNPNGFHTSQSEFQIKINQSQINANQKFSDVIYIPKFAYINTGKTDSKGNDICYSFISPYILNIYSYTDSITNQYKVKVITPNTWPTLYNGKYKKYQETFISNGIAYDTFILNLLDLTSDNAIYVDHDLFCVYIQTINNETGQSNFTLWNKTQNLVLNAKQNDFMYQLRLNQNKEYVLKFGDGIHGAIPQYGSFIHILYFESNGQEGKIDSGQIDIKQILLNIDGFEDIKTLIKMLYQDEQTFKRKYGDLFITNNLFSDVCTKLQFININQSSSTNTFEDIETIRNNAPTAFRRGQRLITQSDFQSYIKQNYKSIVYDVFVSNNNYYISTFYSWLKKYNKLNVGIRQYYYKFADTCDFNNIYIWLVSMSSSNITTGNLNLIIKDCNRLKCATSQLVPLNAVITKFIPFVQHSNPLYMYNNGNNEISLDEYLKQIKIYIYKKQTAIITNQQLKQKVNDIIVKYFLKQNQHIGSTINLSDISSKLLEMGYIKSIKTVNIPATNKNQVEYVNGLSFAVYTTQLVDNLDFTVFTSSYSLQQFQFPKLYYTNILDMIEIKDNSYGITNTEI